MIPQGLCFGKKVSVRAANFEGLLKSEEQRENRRLAGGGGRIRTHETLSGLTVFKTAGFNRSPTPPAESSLTD
jgi:hypothetical protein